MGTWATMVALSESFRDMAGAEEVLDKVEGTFRSLGATHFLATGVPLPGRPIEPLLLRVDWRSAHLDRAAVVQAGDPLIHVVLSSRHAFCHPDTSTVLQDIESPLLAALGTPFTLAGIPVCNFLPYQAVVIAAGQELMIAEPSVHTVAYVCSEAFARMFALGHVKPERPGDLSARERRVVALSAAGKTAGEIARILEISQRTVHAHLQNASEKLGASNKTHTVVEALRYGQITV